MTSNPHGEASAIDDESVDPWLQHHENAEEYKFVKPLCLIFGRQWTDSWSVRAVALLI